MGGKAPVTRFTLALVSMAACHFGLQPDPAAAV